MRQEFWKKGTSRLMVMTQAEEPERIKTLMEKSRFEGAEGFGIQLEQLQECYQKEEIYRELISYTKELPSYVTNYRTQKNTKKTDEELAEGILKAAECGADLCDIMGDYFDQQPGEMTYEKTAVKKQIELIEKLHEKGAQVLMSSHIYQFTPAEEILRIALAQQSRGADICKIVSGAETMEQQIENLKIVHMLNKELKIPFLFLSNGMCGLLRKIGGELGCCMYLCVYEHDSFATPEQPLLKNMKLIRDAMNA